MEGEKLREQGEYWKKVLGGAPELLELPLDHARPAQQDFSGGMVELVLDEKLTQGLKGLSQRHGTTLYMTLLAGWSMLLGRLSGQEEVVIGSPVANRGRTEIEGLIGFFVNTLALRVSLSGSPTVSELLEQVKKTAIEAQQHQDVPFEQVVELLQPVRSLAYTPIFQVMFTWETESEGRLELSGLQLKPLEQVFSRRAKFDLSLGLQESGDRIIGEAVYSTALFEAETVKRYLGYLHTLLMSMVEHETERVDRLRMLSAAEREQLLYGWNETKTEFPSESCVHELLEQQVERPGPAASGISDLRTYILDHHREPVPAGVIGEIYVGGACVMHAYQNPRELAAERFVPDPFIPEAGARMYKTGEEGKWLPGGEVEFFVRNDSRVTIRGFRIELREIESRLAEYPGVREAVVIVREDAPGDKRLVGYYTTAQNDGWLDAGQLRSHLAAKLPDGDAAADRKRQTGPQSAAGIRSSAR
jgi:non-ribosomal peptide synthetase component F